MWTVKVQDFALFINSERSRFEYTTDGIGALEATQGTE